MSLLQKSQSVELSRRTQPFFAKKTSYSLGQQVQIEIDTQREFLDFENARLVFNIETTGTSVSAVLNEWVAGQCIENLRVKTLSGQMIGHEIRQYRTTYTMLKELKSNQELNASYDAVMEGATATTQGDADSHQFAHRIEAHIFGLKEYYPAHFHQGLMIEFDLPGTIAELSHGATLSSTMTIENPRYICDLVQLKPEIENEMVRLMEEQKLFIDYTEWLEQENQLTAAATGASYDVVGIDGRVKSAFVFQIQDDSRDGVAEGFYDTWQRVFTDYRFRLGSRYLNYAPIPCSDDVRAEQVYELLKALDYHSDDTHMSKAGDGTGLTPALLNSARFVVGIKVDKAMRDVEEVISSQVDKDRNNMRVELTIDATLANDTGTIYTIVMLDKRLQLLPGSIVRSVRS